MQNLLRISESWHDPVTGLNRFLGLIIAVCLAEVIAVLLKGILPFSPVYLQGLVRVTDICILLLFGPWSLDNLPKSSILKENLLLVVAVCIAGILFLFLWKQFLGFSFILIRKPPQHQEVSVLIAFLLTACLISPVAEELVFRGLLYRKMREKWHPLLCIGLLSLAFALVHFIFSGQGLVPFAGSLIFCSGYEKTKSVLTPIFLHIAGNLMIFLMPYMPFQSFWLLAG